MVKVLQMPIFITIILLLIIIYFQYGKIGQLQLANTQAHKDIIKHIAANDNLITQYQLINRELSNAKEKNEQAERQSYLLRQKLRQAQTDINCADVSVPGNVIKLQREAIDATNARTSNSTGVTVSLLNP